MTRIGQKSFAFLIDELITTSMKLWHAQEAVMHGADDTIVAAAGRRSQQLNARRNALMRALDERAGDGDITITGKTYG